jgi:site-specific DNA recombinase
MKVAGYIRVSSEDQLEGRSLEAQEFAIRDACASRDWQLTKVYRDEGLSARKDSIAARPAFAQLLDDCRQNQYGVVVVHNLDRFSRNLRVTLDAFKTLADRNIAFVSLSENIDYSTPEGRLFLGMLGAFAQYFSDSLSKHTSKGMAARARAGLPCGPVPFGYQLDRATSDVAIPLAAEADAIRTCFEMFAGGRTMRELAAFLNERDFKTRHRAGQPQRFTIYSLRSILANPFYTGRITYHGEVLPGKQLAIVDDALFDAAQRQRGTQRGSPKQTKPYLLVGLLRCACCGVVMWGESSGRHGSAYYRVSKTSECEFAGRAVKQVKVDAQIGELVSALTLQDGWHQEIRQHLLEISDAHQVEKERHRVEDRKRRLMQVYVDGGLSDRAYQAQLREINERLDSLKVPEVDASLVALNLLDNFGQVWQGATVEERRLLIRPLLEAIYFDMGERRIKAIVPSAPFRAIVTAASEKLGWGERLMPAQAEPLNVEQGKGEGLVETGGN